ncbi:hypothetical protein [Hwangdonia seohaensis]|uniref:Uncharacterized protein n=1 Tax=Hwangdonia seohaensis TaxID=1240727 RepID=A0ABW3RAT6_9FLAO|nr:hypothetical protein [Hwangdonia seohaensis]
MVTQTLTEYIRRISVESCFELSAFTNGWTTWKARITAILGSQYNQSDILNLGDNLSDIFLSTRAGGRTQDSLSGGGYGWEGLVCWYLNLCFAGTRAVAVRKTSNLPEPLRDCISVNYGNFRSNTESDIVIMVFPNQSEFTNDRSTLNLSDSQGNVIPNVKRGNFNYKEIVNRLAELHFDDFELGVIQCKTNWNDNAQIPMLWSMIYETNTFANNSISLGRNNYSMKDLANFSYSFMTVPTNALSTYKQNSTSVNRVRNLTGGNYWGYPTSSSIASSIKEIYNNNFRNVFPTNVRRSIANILSDLNGDLDYFDIT